MDTSISDDELAALGFSFDDHSFSPLAPSTPSPRAAEPPKPIMPLQKGMSQADIDALIASMNS
ncbi:MAG TPA: hypothetical protein VGJ97_00275 [Anaerolineaceae bacterium]